MMHATQAPNHYRQTRTDLGMSQDQVARAANVSVRTIANAEAGRKLQPSIRARIETALRGLQASKIRQLGGRVAR